MNAYHETLTLPADTIDRLEELCRGPATDCRRDECVFDREVEFDDGRRMAIQVIASSEPAEGCWTQGVLFDADGAELGCTDVCDAFAGEYVVECDGRRYAAVVAAADLRAAFLAMAEAILDDENGISERAYSALLKYAETVSGQCANELRRRVDATDGRFYLPSEARS